MEFVNLGDIVTIKKGKKPLFSESPNEKSVRVLQIDDLRNDNNLKFTEEKTGVLVDAEDVLLAWDGANAGTIGYGKTGYIGSTIAVLKKKNPQDYSTIFIGKFLQSQFEYLRSKATGATIPHIDRKSLDGLKLPVIDLYDQIRIAEILTQAENLITQRKESILLLDELLKSSFLEMFGDPVRNEKDWKNKSLDTLIDKKRGISYGIVQRGREENIGIPVVRIRDVESAKYRIDEFVKTTKQISDKYKRTILEGGEILISIRGTVGKLSIAPHYAKGWNISREVAIIPTIGQTNKLFLLHLLKSFPIQQKIAADIKGVAQSGINLSDLRNLKIILPHESLQIEFATIVEKVEVLKSEYQASLKELENMYGVLSQKAFTGELNLKKLNK